MQQPWAVNLLQNNKTIETRAYPLPPSLLNVRLSIIESKKNLPNVSALKGNIFRSSDPAVTSSLTILGWVKFGSDISYTSRKTFEDDVEKHMVTPESGYGWKEGTEVVHGWVVEDCGFYDEGELKDFNEEYVLVRRLRSIFEVERVKVKGEGATGGGGGGKKKKNKKNKNKQKNSNQDEGLPKKKKKRF
ncbi:hypothetical protein TrVE_jg4335 [Triparma verrucosa]|nr:hypothetical protein TrVE_jg4335 [Triparma verrucosa]